MKAANETAIRWVMMITGRTLVSTGILVSGQTSLTLHEVLHTDRNLIRWKKGTSQMRMPLGMAKLRDHKQQVLASNPSIHNHRIDGRQPFCPVFCVHIRTLVKSRAGTEGSLRL